MSTARGPQFGDSTSLWNFTPSPGWSKTEVAILRLCLMSYGVGRWRDIQQCGLLPGKTVQQLSGQTQRLLGQQALVANKRDRASLQAVATHKYGLSDEAANNARRQMEGIARKLHVQLPEPLRTELYLDMPSPLRSSCEGATEDVGCDVAAISAQSAENNEEEVVDSLTESNAEALPEEGRIKLLRRLQSANVQLQQHIDHMQLRQSLAAMQDVAGEGRRQPHALQSGRVRSPRDDAPAIMCRRSE